MAGRGGGLRALRERFGMHGWAPPTAGVNFVVLGRPVGEGSTEAQRWLTALGWVSPAHRWRSSVVEALSRRTRVACGIWPRGPMKPPTRAQYPFIGWVGPIGLADKKSLGRPTRRLSRHPMGDRDSRHRMDERHLRTASIGAHRETSVDVLT